MTSAPVTPPQRKQSNPAVQVGVFTNRVMAGWRRSSGATVQTILSPALLLVMYTIVLGDSVTKANAMVGDPRPSIYGYVSLVAVVGATSGSALFALTIFADRDEGLLSRFWTMPVNRASDLIGRMLGEAIRALLIAVVISLVGHGFGFRFHGGVLATLGFFLVIALIGVVFGIFVAALTAVTNSVLAIDVVSLATSFLMFFNTGFVPLIAYPQWMRPLVQNQPLSCAVQSMRELAWDGAVTRSFWLTLAWSAALLVLFSYPAIRGYRRAATDPPQN